MRVQSELSTHLVLRRDRAVELHDEVMASMVLGLVFGRWAWEIEDTPIGQVTDGGFALEEKLGS